MLRAAPRRPVPAFNAASAFSVKRDAITNPLDRPDRCRPTIAKLDADLVEVAERQNISVTRLVAHEKFWRGVDGATTLLHDRPKGGRARGAILVSVAIVGSARTTRRSVSTRASTASSWFRSSSVSGVPRGQGAQGLPLRICLMSRSSRRRPLSIRPSPRPMVRAVSSPISAGHLSRSVINVAIACSTTAWTSSFRASSPPPVFGLGIDCDRSALVSARCARSLSRAALHSSATTRHFGTRMPFCRIGPPEIASRRQWLAGRSRVRLGPRCALRALRRNLGTCSAMPREKAQAELVPDGARSFGPPDARYRAAPPQ